MVFIATFNNILVINRGDHFYWWKKPEYPKKTTHLGILKQNKLLKHTQTGYLQVPQYPPARPWKQKAEYNFVATLANDIQLQTLSLPDERFL